MRTSHRITLVLTLLALMWGSVAALCAQSAHAHSRSLRFNVVSRGAGFVVVQRDHLAVKVRRGARYASAAGCSYLVTKRSADYVLLRRRHRAKPVTGSPIPAPAGAFNVRDYGARGDGSGDDATAFRAACRAAHVRGGGIVYVPPGTYRLVSDIVLGGDLDANVGLSDHVTLQGAGAENTFLVANGSTSCNGIGAVRSDHVAVLDLTIRVPRERRLATQQDGIKMEGCTNVLLQDVETERLYIGIGLYACTDTIVDSCTAVECDVAGISLGDYADENKRWVGTDRVVVSDCVATLTRGQGFRVSGLSRLHPSRHVTLDNCRAEDSGQNGFLLRWATSCTLSGCAANSNGSNGFELIGSWRNLLEHLRSSDNAVVDTWCAGINMDGEMGVYGPSSDNRVNACVCGNTATGTQRYGYREWQAGDGNRVVDCDFAHNLRAPEYGPTTVRESTTPF